MKYGLVAYNSPKDLVEKVNEALSKGWEPLGGVSWNGRSYLQAIVNEDMEPDEVE